MDYTPEMLAMLERQRAYFASDDHLRREAEPWADSTPTERIAEVASMCRMADRFMDLAEAEGRLPKDPMSVEERFPADTLELFRALRRQAP